MYAGGSRHVHNRGISVVRGFVAVWCSLAQLGELAGVVHRDRAPLYLPPTPTTTMAIAALMSHRFAAATASPRPGDRGTSGMLCIQYFS